MPPRDLRSSDNPSPEPNAKASRIGTSRDRIQDSDFPAANSGRKVSRSGSAAHRTNPEKTAGKFVIQTDGDAEPEELDWVTKVKQEVTEGASGILVSVALHLVLFFILGLFVYKNASQGLNGGGSGIISTFISTDELDGDDGDDTSKIKAVEIESVKADSFKPASTETGSAPAKTEDPNSPGAIERNFSTGKPAGVGGALGGRSGGQKGSLLKAFGGTKQSEDAVGRGLGWLAKQQQSDGRWELHRGYDNPGRENLRTDTGATSLALMCFLGAGFTHQDGKYKEVVRKGLDWLKKVQRPDGNLHDWQELGRQTAFYAHGQGTIVLCEAYALTRDSSLQEPARKALQFIYDSQNEKGGWQYQPGAVGDLSVTGWQIMAIQSARMAGFEVPEEVIARLTPFLNSVSSEGGRRYRYKAADPETLFSPAMTAEGLLCRQYLGWKREHPAMQDGVEWLLEDQNMPAWKEGRRNVYYWYYATQVMHHMGGPAWEKWNNSLRDQISSAQVKSGKLGGSWHPTKPMGDNHEYGEAGGRLYVTCLSILTLEVYYRHMPLYQDKPASE